MAARTPVGPAEQGAAPARAAGDAGRGGQGGRVRRRRRRRRRCRGHGRRRLCLRAVDRALDRVHRRQLRGRVRVLGPLEAERQQFVQQPHFRTRWSRVGHSRPGRRPRRAGRGWRGLLGGWRVVMDDVLGGRLRGGVAGFRSGLRQNVGKLRFGLRRDVGRLRFGFRRGVGRLRFGLRRGVGRLRFGLRRGARHVGSGGHRPAGELVQDVIHPRRIRRVQLGRVRSWRFWGHRGFTVTDCTLCPAAIRRSARGFAEPRRRRVRAAGPRLR